MQPARSHSPSSHDILACARHRGLSGTYQNKLTTLRRSAARLHRCLHLYLLPWSAQGADHQPQRNRYHRRPPGKDRSEAGRLYDLRDDQILGPRRLSQAFDLDESFGRYRAPIQPPARALGRCPVRRGVDTTPCRAGASPIWANAQPFDRCWLSARRCGQRADRAGPAASTGLP